MDTNRTSIIGWILMALIFIGFFWYQNLNYKKYTGQQQHIADSLAHVAKNNALKAVPAPSIAYTPQKITDSATNGGLADSTIIVQSNLMKISFSTLGGQPTQVELLQYKNYRKQNVVLGKASSPFFNYNLYASKEGTLNSHELIFEPPVIAINAAGNQVLSFIHRFSDGSSVEHRYEVLPNQYLFNFEINFTNPALLVDKNKFVLNWRYTINQQERDIRYERSQFRIGFYEAMNYDFDRITGDFSKSFDKPLQWLSMKQQFFNATVLAKYNFSAVSTNITQLQDTAPIVATANTLLTMNVPATGNSISFPMQLYFGPNDYATLKAYGNGMYNLIDLGSGVTAFVKYINRYIVMPVFNFLSQLINSYGLVIALLTILIRVVTSPLTYSSYLSGAKMKLLRPELDIIKKKFGDDQQGYAIEQMKLFREAGVSPLGGCIPALLQLPIFFALYSFFSSELSLRGQSFLWSKDLSSYDVIATLPFTVPFGYGNHVSLFTLTAIITSLLISLYGMSMAPDQSNPALKYMPFITPVFLLFFFNSLPSALTWYYTVSNSIALGLQFVIQNYIIDHKQVLAKIELSRKKPKAKSKWQEQYGKMLESQKKLQDLKQKTNPKS